MATKRFIQEHWSTSPATGICLLTAAGRGRLLAACRPLPPHRRPLLTARRAPPSPPCSSRAGPGVPEPPQGELEERWRPAASSLRATRPPLRGAEVLGVETRMEIFSPQAQNLRRRSPSRTKKYPWGATAGDALRHCTKLELENVSTLKTLSCLPGALECLIIGGCPLLMFFTGDELEQQSERENIMRTDYLASKLGFIWEVDSGKDIRKVVDQNIHL